MSASHPSHPRVEPWVEPSAGFASFFSLGSATTIHGRFEEMVRLFSRKPAVTSGGEAWSYDCLNRAANRMAWRLRDAGLQTGERVALVASHHPRSLAAHLGISKAGGAVVPLDPAGSPAQLAPFLEDCAPRHLISEPSAAPLRECAAAAGCEWIVLGDERNEPEHNLEVTVSPDDPYVIIYSSGSTGVPKGVVLTHRQRFMQSGYYANALGIGRGDRWSFLHHMHSAGSLADFVSALMTGATLAMYDASSRGLSGMADWIREQRLTVLHWIPSGFRRLAASLAPGERLDGLRLVLLGSEPALSSDLTAFQRHFSPPCVFVNRFAAAEAGCPCLFVADHTTPDRSGVLPAGRVVPAWKVEVTDDSGTPLPAGEVGMVTIRSSFGSSGYWGRPDLTEASFRTIPGSEERTWISGDLGRFEADGTLVHLGRSDSVVKVRGRKVVLLEVEAALMEHSAVGEAAVVARPSPAGELRLIAYLVLPKHTHAVLPEIRKWLADRLPSYAVPERIVVVDALPRTRTAKLDRRSLPDPGFERPQMPVPFAPPGSPLEEAVAGIWSTVMQIDSIGREDPFLDLGGTSLMAGQIVARVFTEWGVQLTPAEVVHVRTVAGLAALVLTRLTGGLDGAELEALLAEAERPSGRDGVTAAEPLTPIPALPDGPIHE